jgi:nanoRNase/pAp phosphatase (c-di-AMP/oligoRNAs hydrolase)
MIYALFPDTTLSIHVMWGLKQQNTVFAIGKSIVNRSSAFNIGELCLDYGGGGHLNADTCQIDNQVCETKLTEVITRITGNSPAVLHACNQRPQDNVAGAPSGT